MTVTARKPRDALAPAPVCLSVGCGLSAARFWVLGVKKMDGTVEGTNGSDLIDESYTGDPEGDRIDANDALLPGAARNITWL